MAPMVTFAEDNAEPVKLLLFGPEKNRVRMDSLRDYFKDWVVVDSVIVEAGDDGLSENTFVDGKIYRLTRPPGARPAAEPAPSVGTLSFFKIER
jgi:hypothetical protein